MILLSFVFVLIQGRTLKYYINAEAKKNLREKLKQGALCRAERDLGITQDWFNIDEESWQNGK